MANALNWFEIPVADITRAKTFYGTILNVTLEDFSSPDNFEMVMLPSHGGVGGALLHGEGYTPGYTGSLVYLNGGEDLTQVLSRVDGAGGKVLGEKMGIGDNGFVAFFEDTEGNRVGLHSMT